MASWPQQEICKLPFGRRLSIVPAVVTALFSIPNASQIKQKNEQNQLITTHVRPLLWLNKTGNCCLCGIERSRKSLHNQIGRHFIFLLPISVKWKIRCRFEMYWHAIALVQKGNWWNEDSCTGEINLLLSEKTVLSAESEPKNNKTTTTRDRWTRQQPNYQVKEQEVHQDVGRERRIVQLITWNEQPPPSLVDCINVYVVGGCIWEKRRKNVIRSMQMRWHVENGAINKTSLA